MRKEYCVYDKDGNKEGEYTSRREATKKAAAIGGSWKREGSHVVVSKDLQENPAIEAALEYGVEGGVDKAYENLPNKGKKLVKKLDPVRIVKHTPHVDRRTSTPKGLARLAARGADKLIASGRRTFRKEETELQEVSFKTLLSYLPKAARSGEAARQELQHLRVIKGAAGSYPGLQDRINKQRHILSRRIMGHNAAQEKILGSKPGKGKGKFFNKDLMDKLLKQKGYGDVNEDVRTKIGGKVGGFLKRLVKKQASTEDKTPISYACLLDPNCPGKKYNHGNWCSACLDAQPQTKEQAIKHHKGNTMFYGAILPYQPFRKMDEETLNELSPNLLKRYIVNAVADKHGKAVSRDILLGPKKHLGIPDFPKKKEHLMAKFLDRKMKGRIAGIHKAMDKLGYVKNTRHRIAVQDLILKKLKEDVEPMNEISTKLLKNYLNKVGNDSLSHLRAGFLIRKAGTISKYDPATNEMTHYDPKVNYNTRKYSKRYFGKARANEIIRKRQEMAKILMRNEETNLQETSKARLFRYMFSGTRNLKKLTKRGAELNARHDAGHYVPETEANTVFRKIKNRIIGLRVASLRAGGHPPGKFTNKLADRPTHALGNQHGSDLNKIIDVKHKRVDD